MRNDLPAKPLKNECAIVNLDASDGPGTHWVAYKKFGNSVEYYDSFGKLRPPIELINYFGGGGGGGGGGVIIKYNYANDQSYDSVRCGHLCLRFLYK